MKIAIRLLVSLATLVGMITWALSATLMDDGNALGSVICGILTLLIVVALILLFRWDKKRINTEAIELQ
ncbi:MAG: hypothetical protein LUQ11_02570 [Methylococcaceae bacterium]|nr:hypothetical protein [Methylococcaceae bacterium]